MRELGKLFILFTLLTVIASCSPERRLASRYLNNKKSEAILLVAPDFIYKNSYKVPFLENFDSYSQYEKDSISYFTSDVVQYINDSVYISLFMNSLSNGLRYFGYKTYNDESADKFLEQKNNTSLIINYAQIQVEEYFDSINKYTSYDYLLTQSEPIFITAINMNNWLELAGLNNVDSSPIVLFNTRIITDDFKGNFIYYPLTGSYSYRYTIDSLSIDKLYNAAHSLGSLHSQWIFDYLMNEYVRKNLPQNRVPQKKFTFDLKNGVLKKMKRENFEVITDN